MLFGESTKSQAEAEYPELWRGLVGAWCPAINPPGGTVLYDWSPNKNHGTLTNMDPATDWVTSGGYRALDFDGTNDRINCGTSASHEPNNITLVSWARTSKTGNTGNGCSLIDKARTVGSAYLLSIGNRGVGGNLGRAAFEAYGGSWKIVESTASIADGAVHQVVATYDGSTAVIYTDGIGRNSSAWSISLPYTSNGALNLGRYAGNNDNYLQGQLFVARIYNRVWNARDVALDFSLGVSGWAIPRRRRWNYATAQTAIPYWVFARKNARLIGGGVS